MNKIVLFSLFSMVLSQAGAADSKKTQMNGVSAVCGDRNSFIAFNTQAHRIWVGEGPFQVGTVAIELDQVAMTSKPNLLSFQGKVEMSWGRDVYLNLIRGSINFLTSPATAQIITKPLGANNGNPQPQTKVLQCRAVPLT